MAVLDCVRSVGLCGAALDGVGCVGSDRLCGVALDGVGCVGSCETVWGSTGRRVQCGQCGAVWARVWQHWMMWAVWSVWGRAGPCEAALNGVGREGPYGPVWGSFLNSTNYPDVYLESCFTN